MGIVSEDKNKFKKHDSENS